MNSFIGNIANEFFQLTPPYSISNLFHQLIAMFRVVSMISMEQAIFGTISFPNRGLHFHWSSQNTQIFNLMKNLC